MALLGHVDNIGNSVTGWAVDFEQPNASCALDIIINAERRVTILTGSFQRNDVAAFVNESHKTQLPAEGPYGFSVDIGPWLVPGKNYVSILYNKTQQPLPNGTSTIDKAPADYIRAMEGLDGYLFAIDHEYKLYDNLAGAIELDGSIVDQAVKAMITADWCLNAKRIAFDVSICPDRTIFIRDRAGAFNEHAPLQVSENRNALQLLKVAQRYGFDIHYDIETFTGWETDRIARRTDTHLTPRACHALARRILERIGTAEDLSVFDAFWTWEERDESGDLSGFFPDRKVEVLDCPQSSSPVDTLFDTKRTQILWELVGHAATHSNPQAPKDSILVFGTSSSTLVSQYLSSVFKNVINVWGHGIDWSLIESIKPTAIAVIFTERVLRGRLFTWDLACRPDARRKIIAALNIMATHK